MKRLAIVLAVSLVAASSAPAAPTAGAVEARPEEIRLLMRITGARDRVKQVQQALIRNYMDEIRKSSPTLPPRVLDDVQKTIDQVISTHVDGPDGLMERTVAAYQRHFTRSDIEELIRFYQGPVGHKWLQELPSLMRDVLGISRTWGEALVPELQSRLEQQLRADGALGGSDGQGE